MLSDAYQITTGPVCIRWPKTAAPSVADDEVGSGLRARMIRRGPDVCIIGVGKMVAAATEASEMLEADGISATVWDPRAAKPLDPIMLSDAADHRLVVTIEDGLAHGGIGSAIDLELAKLVGSEPMPEVRVLGVPTEYLPHGKADAILAELKLDGPGVAETVRSLIRR